MLTEEESSLLYYQDNGFYIINSYLRKQFYDDEFIKFNNIEPCKLDEKI